MISRPVPPDPADAREVDVVIVGAGPIGLACGIEARRRGCTHCIFDKGCITNSIFHYPAAMRFFSTPDLLEIGGVPFISREEKPTRIDALEYYRRTAGGMNLDVRLYEAVTDVEGTDGAFRVRTEKREVRARKVIVATGFFDRPRLMGVPGEDLPKTTHYYREAHLYAGQRVLVAGSGNSAAKTALDIHRHGGRVTVVVRGEGFHDDIKYWIRPDLDNRILLGEIEAYFRTRVLEIAPDRVTLQTGDDPPFEIPNDFVLALTGYQPDYVFIKRIGIEIGDDPNRIPVHDPVTYETNRPGIYLAGVVVGGLQTSVWFIENSRAHAAAIFDHLEEKEFPRQG